MEDKIHIFNLQPDWKMVSQLSIIDRFGGMWSVRESKDEAYLTDKKLRALSRSLSSAARLDGIPLSVDEAQLLIQSPGAMNYLLPEHQLAAGYLETLMWIENSFSNIQFSDGYIKKIHHQLLAHSRTDTWHRGNFKTKGDMAEWYSLQSQGTVSCKTLPAGIGTDLAFEKLVNWYNSPSDAHPLVQTAICIYTLLGHAPFQTANMRLAMATARLMLLKNGYTWIKYTSLESEWEKRNAELIRHLIRFPVGRTGEDVYEWVSFFISCIHSLQQELEVHSSHDPLTALISPREKKVLSFIENHPGTRSGEISKKLAIPSPSVKRILSKLVAARWIHKHGAGVGTCYDMAVTHSLQPGLVFSLGPQALSISFRLKHSLAFIRIQKIILIPQFSWQQPEEWAEALNQCGLGFEVTCNTHKLQTVKQMHSILAFNHPCHFQPVFNLAQPISIPIGISDHMFAPGEYPVDVVIELKSSDPHFPFEVQFVYDISM